MNGGLSPEDVERLIRKHAAEAGVEIGLKEGTTGWASGRRARTWGNRGGNCTSPAAPAPWPRRPT